MPNALSLNMEHRTQAEQRQPTLFCFKATTTCTVLFVKAARELRFGAAYS